SLLGCAPLFTFGSVPVKAATVNGGGCVSAVAVHDRICDVVIATDGDS
ncbi:hypothetical protein L195_g062880, partial [Trifolium pratense]